MKIQYTDEGYQLIYDVPKGIDIDAIEINQPFHLFIVSMLAFENFVEYDCGSLRGLNAFIDMLDTNEDKINLEFYTEVRNIYKFWKAYPEYKKRLMNIKGDLHCHYIYDLLPQLEDQFLGRLLKIRTELWS